MTQLRDLLDRPIDFSEVSARLRDQLVTHLDYAGFKALEGGIESL
jgi:lipoyl(octanoyl) transferase